VARKIEQPAIVKQFLRDLATDPAKLGKFIKNPNGELNKAKIPKKYRADIKNCLAIAISKRLVTPPEACTVHLV
jgi:hypothetical protein